MENWIKSKGSVFGKGGQGAVHLCLERTVGKLRAAKIFNTEDREMNEAYMRENENLIEIGKHTNIVDYFGSGREQETNRGVIFMEVMECGDLLHILSSFGGRLDEKFVQKCTKDILNGLKHLHKKKIVHGDLKCQNILVDKSATAKLADFGASLVIQANDRNKAVVGTVWWTAPEVIIGGDYGFPADIWSLGCTVIEMANGGLKPWYDPLTKLPVWQQGPNYEASPHLMIGNSKAPPPFPSHLSDDAIEFISACCQLNPKERPSAQELLRHRWFEIGGI